MSGCDFAPPKGAVPSIGIVRVEPTTKARWRATLTLAGDSKPIRSAVALTWHEALCKLAEPEPPWTPAPHRCQCCDEQGIVAESRMGSGGTEWYCANHEVERRRLTP